MSVLGSIIIGVIVGFIVALVGRLFDKTPDNRFAYAAGGLVALGFILVTVFGVEL